MEELLLIDGLKKSNAKAYKAIFDKYYKSLVLFANSYVKDIAVAEDIVQDFFVYVYEKREELNIAFSFKSFAYVAIKNRSLNHIYKNEKGIHYKNNLDVLVEEDTCEIAHIEKSQKLYAAIKTLPKKNQSIFKLSRFNGYTNQEIADDLGITIRTVETHISNALKELRRKINPIIIFFIKIA